MRSRQLSHCEKATHNSAGKFATVNLIGDGLAVHSISPNSVPYCVCWFTTASLALRISLRDAVKGSYWDPSKSADNAVADI